MWPLPRHAGSSRLARLRRERGLTQAELAERLGVTQPIVSEYERGELRLHGELIVKLTEILRVRAEELLGLEPPPRAAAVPARRVLRRLQEIGRLPRPISRRSCGPSTRS